MAGPSVNGLTIAGGNSTDKGLAISRFSGNGIEIDSAGNDVIQGNYVGTDPQQGPWRLGNAGYGVALNNAFLNTVGGSATGEANVISSNGTGGIYGFGQCRHARHRQQWRERGRSAKRAILASYATGIQIAAAAFGADGTVYLPISPATESSLRCRRQFARQLWHW